MELNITKMMNDADEMIELSGSVCEHGENAGSITWKNSKEYAEDFPEDLTSEQYQELRDYFKGYGAWSEEEISAWSELELRAMLVQDIAGDIRESEAYETEKEWLEAQREGKCGGCFYRDDNGAMWAYIGN